MTAILSLPFAPPPPVLKAIVDAWHAPERPWWWVRSRAERAIDAMAARREGVTS